MPLLMSNLYEKILEDSLRCLDEQLQAWLV